MAAYEYRRLEVGWEDLRPAPADRCRIHDSALPGPLDLMRAPGEGRAAFERRTRDFVTDHLHALGRAGWRVLYYAPAVVRIPAAGVTLIADWPGGTHWLAREVAEPATREPGDPERQERLRRLAERLRMLSAELAR